MAEKAWNMDEIEEVKCKLHHNELTNFSRVGASGSRAPIPSSETILSLPVAAFSLSSDKP